MGTPTFDLGGTDQLAETLDRISDGFISFDRQWRFTYVNRVAADYFGLPIEALVGRNIWELFPNATESTVAQAYRRAAAGTGPLEFEMVSAITGKRVTQRVYPSESGITVYFRDVSAQRQAAETLRESEDRYQSLFDYCLNGVLLTAPTGEILAANPAACRMLGRTEEEICRLGRGIVDPDDPHLALLLAERSRSGSVRAEVNLLRADGNKIPVEISSALFTDRHGQPRTSISIRDLTDRKRAERAMKLIADAGAELSRSLDRDQTLRRLTALVVPRVADVCLVDLWDGARLARRATQRDIEGRFAEALVRRVPDGRENAGVKRVFESGRPELVVSRDDDSDALRALGVRSLLRVPLRVAEKPTGVLSLYIVDGSRAFSTDDLSTIEALADRAALALENARLYEVAVGAQRVRDEVLTMVSHDLRNSLNAIGFIATELARQGGSPLATQIRSAATLADRLLADLGAMQLIDSGSLVLGRFMESVDSIMQEVADLFRPIAEARAIRLRAVSERQGLTAFVDRHRMIQAVSNVVANAVEISEEGGRVDLAVKQVGDDVELAVSDSGPAIAPGDVARLFDRDGWRIDGRRRASVGLGLAISKEYIEAHGGRIRVQSLPGSGSTFTIAIPMRPRGPEPTTPRRASGPPR